MDCFYGDSISVSHVQMGAAAALYPWVYEMLRAAPPPVVKAVAGSCAADQADAICSSSLGSADRAFFMIGMNDRNHYGNNASSLALFDAILRAQAVFSMRNVLTCRQAGWTFGGTWTSSWNPFGIPDAVQTTVNNSTATVQFSGDSFDLGYTQIDTNVSAFSMAVDGASVGSQAVAPARAINTPLSGRIWAPGVVHRSGFGAGTHTLVITANIAYSGGWPSPVTLNWIAQGANGSSFSFLSAPRSSTPDAAADAYNARMAATAAALTALGYNVSFFDTASVVNPAIDLSPSGDPHPSNQGHLNMAGFLKSVV